MAKKKPAPKKRTPKAKPAAVEPVAVQLPDPSIVCRTYTPEQIKAVLDAHYRWLKGETGGIQANLRYANLTSADLTSANLRYANLRYANLTSADLTSANLRYADLTSADLTSADLTSANLRYADLASANLRHANLTSADLRSADLTSANLTSANLRYADLASANLRYANLTSADLRYAKNSELVIARTRILPEGDLIGWKKCRDGVIVKLRIPEAAKRSHAFGRKCRAEFAVVLEVIGADYGLAQHDGKTEYRVGQTVKPHVWCEEFTIECAGGIHFYITKIEAENN